MKAASAEPTTAKQIEDAALKVHVHVRKAVDHASAGDYAGHTPKPNKPKAQPATSAREHRPP